MIDFFSLYCYLLDTLLPRDSTDSLRDRSAVINTYNLPSLPRSGSLNLFAKMLQS